MGYYSLWKSYRPSSFLKWINKYHIDPAEIQDLIQTQPRVMQIQTLDLSVAVGADNPFVINVSGRGFVPYGFQTGTATKMRAFEAFMNVRINLDRPEYEFPAKHCRGFRGDFIKLFLNWPAQAETSVDFMIHLFESNPWQTDGVL